jgi:hypothetical protein
MIGEKYKLKKEPEELIRMIERDDIAMKKLKDSLHSVVDF